MGETLTADRDSLVLRESTKACGFWIYTTTHPLSAVMAPGYFDALGEHGLRRHDRIEVTASRDKEKAEYARLVVTRADKTEGIAVTLLSRGVD